MLEIQELGFRRFVSSLLAAAPNGSRERVRTATRPRGEREEVVVATGARLALERVLGYDVPSKILLPAGRIRGARAPGGFGRLSVQANSMWSPSEYEALRKIAHQLFAGERRNHTLQPTALVHEAYLRIREAEDGSLGDTTFRARAARVMRQILIDYARGVNAQKRGRDWKRTELEAVAARSASDTEDFLLIDEALESLRRHRPKYAELVELVLYSGFTLTEAAETLGMSPKTIAKYWSNARGFLLYRLEGGLKDES